MHTLKVIIASTRADRKGPIIGSWIYNKTKSIPDFKVELVDLAEVNLPFLNEPNHPILQKYQYDHTKKWSELINSTDAFIIVTCEYNFGFPASIKNALDYLYSEWNYKPVGFVSYGGVAAGTRAVQMLKQVVTCLKMMPIAESVNIPFFSQYIDINNKFNSTELIDKNADGMLTELLTWTKGLKEMRKKKQPIL